MALQLTYDLLLKQRAAGDAWPCGLIGEPDLTSKPVIVIPRRLVRACDKKGSIVPEPYEKIYGFIWRSGFGHSSASRADHINLVSGTGGQRPHPGIQNKSI